MVFSSSLKASGIRLERSLKPSARLGPSRKLPPPTIVSNEIITIAKEILIDTGIIFLRRFASPLRKTASKIPAKIRRKTSAALNNNNTIIVKTTAMVIPISTFWEKV